VLLYTQQQAAHQRNLDRTGPGATQHYLDEGIRFTYQSLGAILPKLMAQGWLVLDTTDGDAQVTDNRILEKL
jgi:hypothetical protein